MRTKLIIHLIASCAGLYLALKFVPGAEFLSGSIPTLLVAGVILGLANYLLKPILKAISLPIRILTLGLFNIVIDLFLVWVVVDILFPADFEINGIIALLETTLVIWILNFLSGILKKS
jgi:putative membrane protein